MTPIPKELFKHSTNGDDFRKNAKKIVVNMTSHKKKCISLIISHVTIQSLCMII